MKHKKSQMKIQEMAFMLVGVFFLFTLVGIFLLAIIYPKISEESQALEEKRTLASIVNLAGSPEFMCASSQPNCVDFDKSMALSLNKNFENFWPFSSLDIVKLSAFNKSTNKMILCTMDNYPNCERLVIYDKKPKNYKIIESYVSICRIETENQAFYKKCEIAKLRAGV